MTRSFAGDGTHLQRYARRMSCAEINTSFYREHSVETYRRWASLVPPDFRFSVKLPGLITHELQLRRCRIPLSRFLAQVSGLGKKLGPLLMQLPPSMQFDARAVQTFLAMLRDAHDGAVVCEPRHVSWFGPRAEKVLIRYGIGRVAADPTRIEAAHTPGAWIVSGPGELQAVVYYRLHGSPRKYWSAYEPRCIQQWAEEIAALPRGTRSWCIFDNTASGAALADAMRMKDVLARAARKREPAAARRKRG